MKKFVAVLSMSLIVLACNNNGKEPATQGADTSATSSADSIAKAVDSMKKAETTDKATDTMPKKDSIKR
jgi:hypothetical protein